MSYDNTNTFIFSRNERKTQDTHPDFTGTLNVNGVEYFMDAWVKERKDGTGKFFSGKIKMKNKQPGASHEDRVENFTREVERNFPGATANRIDDDLPF